MAKARKLNTNLIQLPCARARGDFNSNVVNALSTCPREGLWLEINRVGLMAGDAPEMLQGLPALGKARDLMVLKPRLWTSKEVSQSSSNRLGTTSNPPVVAVLTLAFLLERFALSI